MAELYFKIKADYDEIVKMQQEVNRLKSSLSDFSGARAEFEQILSQIRTLESSIKKLSDAAAQEANQAFKEIKVEVGTESLGKAHDILKDFDASVGVFCENLNNYFNGLNEQISRMASTVDGCKELMASLSKTNAQDETGQIEAAKQSITELTQEIEAQKEKVTALQDENQKLINVINGVSDAAAQIPSTTTGDVLMDKLKEVSVPFNNALIEVRDLKQELDDLAAKIEAVQDKIDRQSKKGESTKGLREELADLLEQRQHAKEAYAEARNEVQESLEKYKELARVQDSSTASSLSLAKALNSMNLSQVQQKIRQVVKELARWEEKQKELQRLVATGQEAPTSVQFEMKEAADYIDKCKAEYVALNQRAEELKKNAEQFKEEQKQTAQATASVAAEASAGEEKVIGIRTRIMEARQELIQMIENGDTNTMQFLHAAEAAGKLKKEMKIASATMAYYANDTRHIAALKDGLQGVAGAYGVVTGVMGLMNNKSEEMIEIQTRIQSVMAIVNGLEQAYNAIQETSNFILAAKEAWTWLVATATGAQAAATEAVAVAQEHANVAMMSNPIGAMIAVIVAAAAAIWALCEALTSESEEYKQVQEQLAEWSSAQAEVTKKTAERTAKDITSYEKLRKSYVALGGDVKKQKKWITDNKDEMEKLAIAVDNVHDADWVFIKNTDKVVKAFEMRAEAAATAAVRQEYYELMLKSQLAMGMEQGAGDVMGLKLGDKVSQDLAREAGLDTTFVFGDFQIDTQEELDNIGRVYAKKKHDVNKAIVEYLNKKMDDDKRKYKEGITDMYPKGIEMNDLDKKMHEEDRKEEQKKQKKANETVKSADEEEEWRRKHKKKNKTKSSRYDAENNQFDIREAQRDYAKEQTDFAVKLQGQITEGIIAAMKEGSEKEITEINNEEKEQLEELKKSLTARAEKRRELEKKIWTKSEKGHKRGNWDDSKPLSHYEGLVREETIDENGTTIGDLINQQEALIKLNASIKRIKAVQDEQKELASSLDAYSKYFNSLIQLEKKYAKEREKVEEDFTAGKIDGNVKGAALADIAKRQQQEREEQAISSLKDSPLFNAAFAESPNIDALIALQGKLKEMAGNVQDMSPKAMQEFSQIYMQATEKLIQANPYSVLKKSAEEYSAVAERLSTEKGTLSKLYESYDLDEFGQALAGGVMDGLRNAMLVAQQELDSASLDAEQAQIAFDSATEEKKAAAAEKLETALKNKAAAAEKAKSAMFDYENALKTIRTQEEKVNNLQKQATNTTNTHKKAVIEARKAVGQWANALRTAAGLFDAPIAEAISGVANLADTTMNSIDQIGKITEKTGGSIKTVGQAVQSAVFVLQIIQMAWQVINTIIGLFTAAEEKNYQKRISNLEGQIDALKYQFSELKERMDDTWGTKAIDAYTKAVEKLDNILVAQKQKIEAKLLKSSKGFMGIGGYSSLRQKINENVTRRMWDDLSQETGLNIHKAEDLVNLTPEQMARVLNAKAWTAIQGVIYQQESKAYSGTDFISDLHEIANSLDEASDLAEQAAAKFNGITLDGLRDEFKSLVTEVTTSLNDINKSFDGFMREAVWNKAMEKYDEDLRQFYDDLTDLNEQFQKGEITEEEYRRRVAQKRAEYERMVKGAQDDYEKSLTDAGINVKDVAQNATTGGFEAMSEDTGTELNGRFAALQAQGVIIAENTLSMSQNLIGLMGITDEIRTIQVNSYLELQAIAENTKKSTLQNEEILNVMQQVKRNTDSL